MINQSSLCTNLFHMAERELAAFLCAVEQSYGPQQAALSAQDWLAELEALDVHARLTESDWRQLTIAAAVRLANRIAVTRTSETTA